MKAKWLWLVAAVGVVALTGAVAKFSADEAAPVPAASVPVPAASGPQLNELGERALRPVAALPQEAEPLEDGAVEDVAPALSVPQLDGFWQAHVDSGDLQETMRIVIKQDATKLTIWEPNGFINLVGALAGRYIKLVDAQGSTGTEFKGSFAPDWQSGTFKGWFVSPDGEAADAVSVRIERLSGEEQVAGAATESRREEAEAMYAPLLAYFEAHGCFPGSLEDLVPNHVPNLEAFADAKNRTVSYHPARTLDDLDVSTAIPELDDGSGIPFPDRLMAHEAELREAWGGTLPGLESFLRVSYADPPQSFAIQREGVLEEGPPGIYSEGIGMCQNNLKYLVLASKIFEGENGGYTLPGWHTAYPQYLTEAPLLTCQAELVGTDSYEIFFPATHADFFVELYEAVNGEPADRSVCQARIPLIAEREDHASGAGTGSFGTTGRNVAFADGHVEFVTTQDWETMVAPYLEYR